MKISSIVLPSLLLRVLPWMMAGTLSGTAAVSDAGNPVPPKKLLVIAPQKLQGALQKFLGWKNSLLPVESVALEEVLAKSTGADDPEKLKRYLFQGWKTRNIGYVLLVGDVDVMPVRYMVLDRKTEAAFDYAFYPSDLYYADLAKPDGGFEDWNAQQEGFHADYYGEVRGEANKSDPINFDQVDYLPEVAVGRWPMSTEVEVQRMADKSMTYERSVLSESDAKLRRAALIAVDGWVDARGLLGSLGTRLEPGWQIEKRFYGTDSPPPNNANLRTLLNDGVGLVVHAGHGNPDRWEQCLSVADLDQLTTPGNAPVFLSAGCSTAHFAPLPPYEPFLDREGKSHAGTDHGEKFTAPPPPPAPLQPGAVNPSCLGEALLKREGSGGVAYIGCNTGSQPPGLTLVDGFLRELATAKSPQLGDCWNAAINYYVVEQKLRALKPTESWLPPSIFFQGMKFMVFGDPSLHLPANAKPAARQKQEKQGEQDLRPALQQAGVTPRQQGSRGTCSVFTVAAALEYALAKTGAKPEKTDRLSVEYLNWASNEAIHDGHDGGFFSDLWKGYEAWGMCTETEMPYAATFNAQSRPSSELAAKAKAGRNAKLQLHWIKRWNVNTGLTAAELSGVEQTLTKGWPVCGGFRWPRREEWREHQLQMTPPDGVFDGHSILLTGFKRDPSLPGGGVFTFFNTNRPNQECRMTYEYALAYMNDAMWIEAPEVAATVDP